MARGLLPGRVKRPEDKLCEGRPRKQPPDDAADVIRTATATGASKMGTAMALGVTSSVLTRWLDERPDLKAAFDEGRERERQTLHAKLYETAMHGEGRDALLAGMFLLKARHAYREGDQSEQGNRLNVVFNVPGAMPLDQFMTVDECKSS